MTGQKINLRRFFVLCSWFLWMSLIFYLSSRSVPAASQINWQDFTFKKSAHVFVYFILTILTFFSLPSGVSLNRKLLISFLWATFYGVTDEIHQGFTPGREPHVRDVMFDSLGSIIAVCLIRYSHLKTLKI